jgi:hypothetical protein
MWTSKWCIGYEMEAKTMFDQKLVSFLSDGPKLLVQVMKNER